MIKTFYLVVDRNYKLVTGFADFQEARKFLKENGLIGEYAIIPLDKSVAEEV